ncbi:MULTISPECIES: histidinol dehydrogenase [unclassified Helicobacter]|uniref:histidinol dehydrogenase n=1 Tax=unclassified Helicobacter TaxID=2593540 RepID=UPI000CF0535E|nr:MULTISPECIES: histidinol dehydrogenase [unclassified Helicobacter]
MNILNSSDSGFEAAFGRILMRGKQDIKSVSAKVSTLLQEIQDDGLQAVLAQIARFDSWNPKSLDDIKIAPQECQKAYEKLDSDTRKSLHIAYDRIFAFHQKQKQKTWLDFEPNGSMLGQMHIPIERAGLYIPGGKAAYPSSLLMNAIPAIVAGVEQIVVCTPAPQGTLNPLLLAALHICEIREIYKVGGASAIGLMAYGLDAGDAVFSKADSGSADSSKAADAGKIDKADSASKSSADSAPTRPLVQKVDMISGPGNIFVTTAKKLVFGDVGIDMIAGPSEIAIIADERANADFIAYDLLSQAEHDEMASSFLFTTSGELASIVAQKIEQILPTLPKHDIAKTSINNRGAIIVCKDLTESINLCNALAPEHLELLTSNAFELLPRIKHAGAVFIGENTPEPIGDYLAGPNHTLPTSGSARFFSPLSVDNFMKKSSIIHFSDEAMRELGEHCARLAHLENLDAHRLAVLARLEKSKSEK